MSGVNQDAVVEEREEAASPLRSVVGIAGLAGFAFLTAHSLLGPIHGAASNLLFFLSLLALGSLLQRREEFLPAGRGVSLPLFSLLPLMMLPGFVLLAQDSVRTELYRSVALLTLLWLFALRAKDPLNRAALSLALPGVVAAILLTLLMRHVPPLWHLLDALSLAYSKLASLVAGREILMGATFSGLRVVALFLPLYLISPWPVRKGKRETLLFTTLVLFLPLPCMILAPLLEEAGLQLLRLMLATPEPHRPFVVAPGTLLTMGGGMHLLLQLSLLTLYLRRNFRLESVREEEKRERRGRRFPRIATVVAGTGLFLAGAHLWFHNSAPSASSAKRVVALFSPPYLDWSVPVKGRYNQINAGMFGTFRATLPRLGYETRLLETITGPESLEGVSLLVVINPRRFFLGYQKESIWNFVRKGGALLVLGDHTDIFGTRKPLNDLLEPAGISFRFDSAHEFRKLWVESQEFLPHPVTAGLRSQRDTQIGTGASLRADSPLVRPLLVGRYAFSDQGNRLNEGNGAYLGDYRYQEGERLGDLILAASREVGEGRVVVFGDTSGFQTMALPYDLPLLENLLAYCTHPSSRGVWMTWLLLLLLGGGAALLAGALPVSRPAALLLLLLAGSELLHQRAPGGALPRSWRGGEVAYVDLSHLERFTVLPFEPGSAGGVLLSLFRQGYTPVVGGYGETPPYDSIDLLVVLSPSRHFSPEERERVRRFLERGGRLLVSFSPGEREAADSLLEVCGLRSLGTPLGPVEADSPFGTVRFVEAYPLQSTGGRPFRSYASWKKNDFVVGTRVAGGECLAFGDHRFFDDKNLEGVFESRIPNIRFLEERLRREQGAKP